MIHSVVVQVKERNNKEELQRVCNFLEGQSRLLREYIWSIRTR